MKSNVFGNRPEEYSAKELVLTCCQSFDTKTLILLEHEEQVKDCLGWLDEIKGQKQIIALSPFAICELDRQNIPYRLPEDYYAPQELYCLGMDNYQKVENLCAIIDKSIQRVCPITAKLGIKPALFSFYYLKILYDAATVRLFQLFKVIDAEKPDIVLIYASESYPFGIPEKAPYLIFDNRESIYAQLLALDGWKVPVVMLPHVPQPEWSVPRKKDWRPAAEKLEEKIARWLEPYPGLYDLAASIRNGGWQGLSGRLRGYVRGDKRMAVLGGGYNWNDCKEELQSAGIGHIFRMTDDLKHWLSELFTGKIDFENLLNAWKGLKADSEFRKFFIWDNIDFFSVVEERLQFLVERLTLACLKAYEETSEVLRDKRIRAILGWSFATCTSHSMARAARNAGTPVVTWQHGSYGFHESPIVNYDDLMSSDVHFVFGEGVAERYSEPAKRLGTKLVAVGSASLDALCQKTRPTKMHRYMKLGPKKTVVLYVLASSYYQNHLYLSWQPPWSDNSIWRTQRAILDILGQHKEHAVIVKMSAPRFPREAPVRLYAKGKKIENCRFIRDECSFTDLVPLSDVIVIDFPSTPLLEALTTSKPVFVYTGHLHIDEQAQRLLERRAFCHRELKDFLEGLDRFLSGGTIDVDLNNTEFLRKYGTHEGKSAERAASEVTRIMGETANVREM